MKTNTKRRSILFTVLGIVFISITCFGDLSPSAKVTGNRYHKGSVSGKSLSEVGSWGYGSISGSFVLDNRLYMSSGRVLEILDIGDPSSPSRLGSVTVENLVKALFVKDNFAFAAVDRVGLRVIDVSNPAAPAVVGGLNIACLEVPDLHVSGNYAYLLMDAGLKIIDVTNPASPVEVGFYGLYMDMYGGVHASGQYAYVATDPDNLYILDVSDPANPVEAGYLRIPYRPMSVFSQGSYVYVSTYHEGLRIIDAGDPSLPREVGYYNGYHCQYMSDVYVSGSFAYGTLEGGVVILDISDPATPVLAGLWDGPGLFIDVFVNGGCAYAAAEGSRLSIVNISNLASPAQIATINRPVLIYAIDVVGSYAYLANSNDGLRILDISNPSSPVEAGQSDLPYYAREVDLSGSHAYVAASSRGLSTVDVSNPAAPVEVHSYDPYNDISDLQVLGGYLYLANSYDGLQVMDISDPAVPTPAGNLEFDGKSAEKITCSGSYAYLYGGSFFGIPFTVVDITNPSSPVKTAELHLYHSIYGMYAAGSYVYLASGSGGLRIIDVSNPQVPHEVGFYDTPGFYANNVFVLGSYAYVTGESTGFYIIDVSNPTSPVQVDYFPTPGRALNVFVSAGYAYVATLDCGVSILDVGQYIPNIRVTSPNGGEYLVHGSEHDISWISSGITGNVRIEYTPDNGASWVDIIADTENDGLYCWLVPALDSRDCRVRVSQAAGATSDVSDNVFTAAEERSFTLTAPNGGETWEWGSTRTITWTSTGFFDRLYLQVSIDGGYTWNSILSTDQNTGYYDWVVDTPGDVESDNCVMRIIDFNTGVSDISDSAFTILLPPSLTLISPNGGEIWLEKTLQDITWTSTGVVGDIKIEFSKNNGGSWKVVTGSTLNDGHYQVRVPGVSSTLKECLIRISEVDGSLVDMSDGVFIIKSID